MTRGGMGEVWRADDTVLGRTVDPAIVEIYDYGQAATAAAATTADPVVAGASGQDAAVLSSGTTTNGPATSGTTTSGTTSSGPTSMRPSATGPSATGLMSVAGPTAEATPQRRSRRSRRALVAAAAFVVLGAAVALVAVRGPAAGQASVPQGPTGPGGGPTPDPSASTTPPQAPPETKAPILPSFVGLSEGAARDATTRLGLVPAARYTDVQNHNCSVISQFPAAGSVIDPGSTVTIAVPRPVGECAILN